MTPDEAIEAGALALFGEKYGEEVRVVAMGGADAARGGKAFSTELCGGTHVKRTGDIGFFKVTSEDALAASVRRIEAVAAAAALAYVQAQAELVASLTASFRVSPLQLRERAESLIHERKRLERELAGLRRKLAAGGGAGTAAGPAAREVAGIKFAARVLADLPSKDLKPMADELKKQVGTGVVALVSVANGKASLVVGVTGDLTDRFDAVELARIGSRALGGKGGGGRADMAQAGGPDVGAADEAVAAIEAALTKLAAA